MSESENKKVAFGSLLLRAETNELAKRVITAFDPDAKRTVNFKSLSSFNLDMLEPCAEFLSIKLDDIEGNKLFTKESLVNRIVFALSALLPSVCLDCNECYTVDLDPEEKPLFHCHMCFRGSHNCASLKSFHDALAGASLSLLSGHVWLCSSCKTTSNPIKPRKSKSRHNSVSKSDMTLSRVDSDIASQQEPGFHTPSLNAGAPRHQSSARNTPNPTVQFAESELDNKELRRKLSLVAKEGVCQRYRKGICPHGLKGNKLVDGNKSEYDHPKYCIKFCRHGNQRNMGCTKGESCNFLHPVLCKHSVKKKVCTNEECKFIHLKGTRRKRDDSSRPEPSKGPNPEKKLDNPATEHFLQLQRLVETMQANFMNEIASIRSSLQPLLLHQQHQFPPMPTAGASMPQFQNQCLPQFFLPHRPLSMPMTTFPHVSS